jgi:hypothetical protein
MPRLAGLDASGILHHVMGRGIERKKIFINDMSYLFLVRIVIDVEIIGNMSKFP